MNDAHARSRGEIRQQALLNAATTLFQAQGFERTSLSDIVKLAKGSRTTLYTLFGNKEGLLRAMIEDETQAISAAIGSEDTALDFTEEALVTLADDFVRAILSPRALAVFRILAAEGDRLPEITTYFFERGIKAIEQPLTERFRRALPPLRVAASPEQLVQVFLGAVIGSFHPRHLLGLSSTLLNDGIDGHIRLAVRIFLHGILAPDAAQPHTAT